MKDAPARPFLRWAGSKRKLIPVLQEYWNQSFERYVEPFMGSACLFFHLNPRAGLLGDINAELVECFLQVRSYPQAIHEELSSYSYGPEFFYQLRAKIPEELTAIQRAARFIYLTRYCFNGLYRTNRLGRFNVPFGGDRSGKLPSLEELISTSKRLESVELVCSDFLGTIEQVKAGDFVYLDPPYWVEGRRRTNQYGPKTFCEDDLVRLESALNLIHVRGGHFVLSYEDCDEAREISRSWNIKQIRVRRNVAGFAQHRRIESEMIATNIV
ncbi:DNA adenine methylase [Aromatoleum diolicum]|uniref:Site-specific DNA-methyltransferase (adenine-specific) n=1 Tax=Aromatoleum diolicum TaxID=75796 RepID=A0ABX1QC54_9RHOO|nr:Dam family site-specific DNA-(adenine-N6)-methyltransferase [Aromatoleum diolicum]NMG75954.1 Dam family site-specific DNA-(adenine-N6)-methyltransferase [Aromatoleum diolicum]